MDTGLVIRAAVTASPVILVVGALTAVVVEAVHGEVVLGVVTVVLFFAAAEAVVGIGTVAVFVVEQER